MPKQVAIQRADRDGAAPRPIMLGIAGDSAAGKTTLTRGLVAALGEDRSTSICVDDYHRYDRTERANLPFTPLHPACNYMEVMEQHLRLLAMGESILKPVYDHATGSLARPVLVEPREFVIVEGLLPLHSPVARACFDVKVYLDPPETIRQRWKVARDTSKRGYSERQVIDELRRREPESAAYIRPQRSNADIVVQFSPIEERGESDNDPLSATLLLRPTIRHPDLSGVLSEATRKVMHLKLMRDEHGRPVDALHIHSYAPDSLTNPVAAAIWAEAGGTGDPPPLGQIDGTERSAPLALTQLILLFHMLQAQSVRRAPAAAV